MAMLEAVTDQLIVKLLLTEKGLPLNAGTRTPLKRAATQAPVGVPSKGGPETLADWAPPFGAKTTITRPVPLGPSPFLQPCAAAAAAARRDLASPMLNSAPSGAAGGGAAGGAAACVGAGFGVD